MSDEVMPLECSQVREHLSDLLDIRRGETPPPGATPLAKPAYRVRVETHVNACPDCRNELYTLGDLGRVFSEFDVGERPAQDFDGYAKAVRARLNGQGTIIALPGRALRSRERRSMGWKGWVGVGVTSAAAAMLSVALLGYLKADAPKKDAVPISNEVAENPVHEWKDPIVADTGYRPIDLSAGSQEVTFGLKGASGSDQTVQIGRDSADTLKYLNQTVQREGMVGFWEHPSADETQRMGAAMAVSTEEKANPEGCQKGLAVLDVMKGSPAAKAGLRKGCYVLAINGLSFEKSTLPEAIKYINALNSMSVGEPVLVDYAVFNGKDWIIRRGEANVGQFSAPAQP